MAKILIASCLVALGFAPTAGLIAAPPISQPAALQHSEDQVLTSLTQVDLMALIASEGHGARPEPNEPLWAWGTMPNSKKYLLIGIGCGTGIGSGCTAFLMRRSHLPNNVTSDQDSRNRIAQANWDMQGLVDIKWDPEGKLVYVDHVVIVKNGVTWGNLRATLTDFLANDAAASKLLFDPKNR